MCHDLNEHDPFEPLIIMEFDGSEYVSDEPMEDHNWEEWLSTEEMSPCESAARKAGWTLKDDGAFERCASDEPERVWLLGNWRDLCDFADIRLES